MLAVLGRDGLALDLGVDAEGALLVDVGVPHGDDERVDGDPHHDGVVELHGLGQLGEEDHVEACCDAGAGEEAVDGKGAAGDGSAWHSGVVDVVGFGDGRVLVVEEGVHDPVEDVVAHGEAEQPEGWTFGEEVDIDSAGVGEDEFQACLCLGELLFGSGGVENLKR